ncbi:hypothetical protein LTR85_002519 [Meristemomyces frigidus]|nr:hypothetical protein LTR85_002519 [Meristemomyces frigidus]
MEHHPATWSGTALYRLSQCYFRPNGPSDLTPDAPDHGFGRNPRPAVFPGLDLDNRLAVKRYRNKLIIQWAAMLVQLEEAWLYDGSPASAQLFKQRTTWTPEEFAQGYLETEGSLWCYYTLTSSGGDFAEALTTFWADCVKLWKQWPGWPQAFLTAAETGTEADPATANAARMIKRSIKRLVHPSDDAAMVQLMSILGPKTIADHATCTGQSFYAGISSIYSSEGGPSNSARIRTPSRYMQRSHDARRILPTSQ